MNSNNISKVEAVRHLFTKFLFVFIIVGCNKIKSKSELIFKDCKVLIPKKMPFSGKFEHFKGDKYIITRVRNGTVLNEKKFRGEILLMEKEFNGCKKGFQKIFDKNGKLIIEGSFLSNKKICLWKIYSEDSIYNIKY